MKTLPRIDLQYWAFLMSATTLGETAGDLVSQSMDLGYGGGSLALVGLFVAALVATLLIRTQHVALYWLVIILASTAGTTISDYVTRSLGLGYGTGTLLIATVLAAIFFIWKMTRGSFSTIGSMTKKSEFLYWAAILASSTLGTAFGDLISNGTSLGFAGGTGVLAILLAIIVALYFFRAIPKELSYWLAIIVTHPIGATMGDYLTKDEGFGLGNVLASGVLVGVFGIIILAGLLQAKVRVRPV